MEFVKSKVSDEEEIELAYNECPIRTKEYISEIIMNKMRDLMFLLNECESPIEELMAVALNEQSSIWDAHMDEYLLLPQEPVEIGGNKYRLDFLIITTANEKNSRYVIECDGHEFHEKTKDQVRKDRKRERELMVNGYQVIRFSGSEIYENPTFCAREVTKIILNNQWKK